MTKKIYADYVGKQDLTVRHFEFSNDTELYEVFSDLTRSDIMNAIASGTPTYNNWFFYYEPSVKAEFLTSWKEVLNDARITVNKGDLDKEPSAEFKNSILLSEHSPLRSLMLRIDIEDVPCWVSQHIARHDAFAGHTVRESEHDQHFVATSRTDRTGVDRHYQGQYAPVNHRILLNAYDLIQISRRRLCKCASPETVAIWKLVIKAVGEIDSFIPHYCVPTCVYRGFCPEKCCGYVHTKKFVEARSAYVVNGESN